MPLPPGGRAWVGARGEQRRVRGMPLPPGGRAWVGARGEQEEGQGDASATRW